MWMLKKHLYQICIQFKEKLDKTAGLGVVKKWIDFSNPQLWHFNRRSVARGFAAGLFVSMIPLPLQMLFALLLAVLVKGNVPVAMMATWISNPVTMVFFIYLIYQTGAWVSHEPLMIPSHRLPVLNFNLDSVSMDVFIYYLKLWFVSLGKNFFIGLPIVSVSLAILGYIMVYTAWRIFVLISLFYRHRKKKRV